MKEAAATAQPTANGGDAIPADDVGAGAGSCATELPMSEKIVIIAIAATKTLVWVAAIAP